MTVNNTILLKKITAFFLCVLLCSITVIQVSHSHTSGTALAGKIHIDKNGSPGYGESTAVTKCFICYYQLTKDADANHSSINITSPVEFNIAAAVSYKFTSQSTYVVFETRGPPSI